MQRSAVPDSPSRPDAAADAVVATLVRAACEGDRAAFAALYERHARLVHGVLLAHADRDDVPDLVQEVFLRALRQLHTLRDPSAFGGWVAAMARNEARMLHRSARDTEMLSDETPAPAPSATGDTLQMDDVMRALHALPERYREPLTLRLVEQMGGAEIAGQLGLTHGTVRVYLHHGLRLLREQLGEMHD